MTMKATICVCFGGISLDIQQLKSCSLVTMATNQQFWRFLKFPEKCHISAANQHRPMSNACIQVFMYGKLISGKTLRIRGQVHWVFSRPYAKLVKIARMTLKQFLVQTSHFHRRAPQNLLRSSKSRVLGILREKPKYP